MCMPTFMLGSLTEQCYAMNLPQVKIPIPIHGDLKSTKAITKELLGLIPATTG